MARGAVAAWRWWLASCAVSVVALAWFETATSIHVIYRWCGYAIWCVLQQLLFQRAFPRWESRKRYSPRCSVSTPVALNGQFRVGPGYWATLRHVLAS